MDTIRAEELLSHLADVVDLPPYDDSDRIQVSRTLAITSLHFGASVRHLCESQLALGAATVLRSQFEALLRGVWACHRASEGQIEKLSSHLSLDSQQSAKNPRKPQRCLASSRKYRSSRTSSSHCASSKTARGSRSIRSFTLASTRPTGRGSNHHRRSSTRCSEAAMALLSSRFSTSPSSLGSQDFKVRSLRCALRSRAACPLLGSQTRREGLGYPSPSWVVRALSTPGP